MATGRTGNTPAPTAPPIEEQLMSTMTATTGYELRFRSLFKEGSGLAFPCDQDGRVHMDALSARALNNYLYARTVIGREFHTPAVQRRVTH
jgi:hypothetical protein